MVSTRVAASKPFLGLAVDVRSQGVPSARGSRYRLAMPFIRGLLIALLLCLLGSAAEALEAALAKLERGPSGRVVEVIDGDTVMLSNGLEVRLVGIQAPKLPLGRKNFIAWPLGEEAKAALEDIALNREVELRYGGRAIDRNGRTLAHLIIDGEIWVQGEMLEQGFARVYTFPDNRAVVPELMARERTARKARRGIWTDPFYAPRTPETVGSYVEGYELVEGRVLRVGESGGRIYLNFGADFRTDFTAVIAGRDDRLFEAAGIDPEGYEGRIVRIRGWVESRNGPMIEVTHPEQIELVK